MAGVLGHLRAADGEPRRVAVEQVERLDRAELFDDSGEHLLSSQRRQGQPDVVAETRDVRRLNRRRWSIDSAPRSPIAAKPGAEDGRGDVRDDLVDQTGAQERSGQRRPAFEPEVPDLVVVQLPQHLGRVMGGQQQRLRRGRCGPWRSPGSPGRRRRPAAAAALSVRRSRRGRSARDRRTARSGCRRRSRRTRRACGVRRRGRPAPVIHLLVRSGAAERPSSVVANFQVTNGRPVRTLCSQTWLTASASSCSTPCSTWMFLLRSFSPPPDACRFGSGTAYTTRLMPASISASAHGPVRPVWLHGSSVTYAVPPRARGPAIRSASTSACGPPATRGIPRRPGCPSAAVITQPTTGFGWVLPMPRAASSIARRIQATSIGPESALYSAPRQALRSSLTVPRRHGRTPGP